MMRFAKPLKRGDLHAIGILAHEFHEAPAHRAMAPDSVKVSARYLLRRNFSAAQNIRDAHREHLRLPRPRPGDDHHRPLKRIHCLPLLGVQ